MDIPSINIEYIFLRIYEFVTGVEIEAGEVIPTSFYVVGEVLLAGLVVAVILLALVVYVQIRFAIVEHEWSESEREKTSVFSVEASAQESSAKNSRWEKVMELASSGDEGNWRRAILEADVLLGELLENQGYRGESIGEKLKDVNPLRFNTLDLAWQAHKMRNAVAHLGEAFPLSEREVRATVDQYARVFEEFGVI